MRVIPAEKIKQAVSKICIRANLFLRPDVLAALRQAHRRETHPRAKEILKAIIENAAIARREKLALCQDTGLPCIFVELGQEVKIKGDLKSALNQGVEAGYRKASLRNSIIADPLSRGSSRYLPAVIHIDIVKGRKLKLTVLPKGFGCENKTQAKMFQPTAPLAEIKKFILEAVRNAGPDACPPYVVGVGIGGTADYACLLAKKALLRNLSASAEGGSAYGGKRSTLYAKLESNLLKEINRLNIGPMGLGGKTTALAVNILTYPTHIAGLPACVNISCHSLRSASKKI